MFCSMYSTRKERANETPLQRLLKQFKIDIVLKFIRDQPELNLEISQSYSLKWATSFDSLIDS